MRKVLLFVMLIVLTFGLYSQPVQVGMEIQEQFETPHPYKGRGVVFEQMFHNPGSGYISIHFSGFDLRPGDFVEISSPDGRFYFTYREKGKVVRGGEAVLDNFWARHIPGDSSRNEGGITHFGHLDGRFRATDGALPAPEAFFFIHDHPVLIRERNGAEPAALLTGPACAAGIVIHRRTVAAGVTQLRPVRAQE